MRLLTPVTRYGNPSSSYRGQGLVHWKLPWHVPHIGSKTSVKGLRCSCKQVGKVWHRALGELSKVHTRDVMLTAVLYFCRLQCANMSLLSCCFVCCFFFPNFIYLCFLFGFFFFLKQLWQLAHLFLFLSLCCQWSNNGGLKWWMIIA